MTAPELRCLPRSPAHWERDADVVVVGSGAAGLTAALTAARHGRRVLLLTKEEDIGGGATPLAQGGLAAAIGPGDDPGLHQRDTLDAGAGLCDPAAVATLASEAPARSPAWPGGVPGWSEPRCTWRAGTAASGS